MVASVTSVSRLLGAIPLVLSLAACAAAPRTDPHSAVDRTLEPLRGWRVEAGHVGEFVEVPAPGKVTVVDFWSTSCAPCIEAMPELERIWRRVDCRRVAFVGVSIDTDDSLTRETLEESFPVRVGFPMVYDGKAARLQGAFQVGGTVPSTFVVDRRGRVRFYFDGSPGDIERLERAISYLAAE
ncbi:MAG: TlpA disulfide reductase family protein [Polyangia bacterium]